MNYLSKSHVYITFYGGSIIPSELTNLIDIEPSKIGLKGEKGEYGSILQESFWEYKMRETNALEELENSMLNLIELFKNKTKLIQTYSFKNKVKAKCFIVIKVQNNEDTGVALNYKFIEFLYKLNMTLEVCNYIDKEAK